VQEELDAIDAVAHAVDRITKRGRFAEFKLQNGIVLNLRPIPPLLIQAVNQEFHTPDPPKVYMEEKGRDEPNPNDPAYLKELERLAEAQDLAVESLTLAVGTSVKFVPEGMFKPEDDGWIEQIKFANKLVGIEMQIDEDDPTKRFLYWLRFYAMESASDIALVRGLPTILAGIREGEIEEVLDSFRRLPERGTDPVSEAEAGGENGNRATRRRRRNGAGA
jgi:hypothetical protein